MGNVVVCGLHAGTQAEQEHTRRKSVRSSTSSESYTSSSSSSSASDGDSTHTAHVMPSKRTGDAAPMLPQPLSSMQIHPPSEDLVVPIGRKTGSSSGRARRSMHASDTDKRRNGSGAAQRGNRRVGPQYSGSLHQNSLSADGFASNEMSFSIPEIDSRSSSAGSANNVSVNEASYSFGSQVSAERQDYALGSGENSAGQHSSPLSRSFLDVAPERASPSTAATAPALMQPLNTDFTAWEMGFGIISGAQRVSPACNVRSAKTTPASPTRGMFPSDTKGTPPSNNNGTPTTTTVSPNVPEDEESVTGSQETRRPAEVKASSKRKPTSDSTHAEQPATDRNTRNQSLTPFTGGVVLSSTEAASPAMAALQQKRVSTTGHAKTTSGRISSGTSTTTTTSKATNGLPSKASSPPLKPTRYEAVVSPQPDQVELYDLNFISSTDSPRTLRSTSTVPAASAAATTASQCTNTAVSTTTTFTPPLKKAAISPTTATNPTLTPSSNNAGSPSTTNTTSVFMGANKTLDCTPDRVDVAVITSPVTLSTQANASLPPTAPALTCVTGEPKVEALFSTAAPGSSTSPTKHETNKVVSPPAGPSDTTTTTTTTTELRSRATAAAAAAPGSPSATGGDRDAPTLCDGPPSPTVRRPKKRSSHSKRRKSRRRRHRRDKKRATGTTDAVLEDDSDDFTGESSDSSASSSMNDSRESMSSMASSQKVDSILVTKSSFKSRTGSIGPQDLTVATGSVSFLLGEKEAALAMASSQLMSKAVPRRKKQRLRLMNDDFGMGVLNDVEGDTQAAMYGDDYKPTSS